MVTASLDGHEVQALNGGSAHAFTPAISLSVTCEGQMEVVSCWDAHWDGGVPMACGWLTNRFGVSWQIVPRALPEMLRSADRAAADHAMQAMMTMVKLEITPLEAAFCNEGA